MLGDMLQGYVGLLLNPYQGQTSESLSGSHATAMTAVIKMKC